MSFMKTGIFDVFNPFQVLVCSSFVISSSTNVFHSLHCGHLPNHFGDCVPRILTEKKQIELSFLPLILFYFIYNICGRKSINKRN